MTVRHQTRFLDPISMFLHAAFVLSFVLPLFLVLVKSTVLV